MRKRIPIRLIALSIALGAGSAHPKPPPSAQAPEAFILDTGYVQLDDFPLEHHEDRIPAYLHHPSGNPDFFANRPAEYCDRGYIGTWTLSHDSLFLIGVLSCDRRDSLDLSALDARKRIFASWFSGVLHLGTGDAADLFDCGKLQYWTQYELFIAEGRLMHAFTMTPKQIRKSEIRRYKAFGNGGEPISPEELKGLEVK